MRAAYAQIRARAAVLALAVAQLVSTNAAAQSSSRPGDVVGTIGGACTSATVNYAWPDTNGNVLQCVSNVWVLTGQPVTAVGSTGNVQYNNSGAMGGAANLFWNNGSSFLGIGSGAPVNTLDVNGAIATGTNVGTAVPSQTSLLISGNVGIGSASPIANLDVGGGITIGVGVPTLAATLNGAVTAGTTTLIVNSTTGYPNSGILTTTDGYSSEFITYTGKTSTTFTGCTRGAFGTTATTHSNGTGITNLFLMTSGVNNGLAVYSNQWVNLVYSQYVFNYVTAAALTDSLSGGINVNVGYNSFALANGGGTTVSNIYNTIDIGQGAPNALNSQTFGNVISTAFAEMSFGQFSLATGSEVATSWSGNALNPVLNIGIGTSSGNRANALMIFQNGQMLVKGGSTVAVPTGAASLTPMGTSTATGAASLNATNSSGGSKLYVRNDGNVGIGTTSPANALDVNGGIAINSGVVIGNSYLGLTAPSAGLLVSGNLGIGTASPFVNTDVSGNMIVADGIGVGTTTTGVGVGTTLLNGAITAGTTTIIVNSTANFPKYGVLAIRNDAEFVGYTSKTSTAFLNCTRGIYGTTAQAGSNGYEVAARLFEVAPYSGLAGALEVYSSQSVIVGSPQAIYVRGPSLAISPSNVSANYNSLSIGTCSGSNNPSGGEINSLSMSSTCGGGYGVNSVAFGYTRTAAFAELTIGNYPNATGTETLKSWAGTDPILLLGIGTSGASANGLMVFQNGQMLVNGGTTVAVPTGTASLTAMGTTTTNAAAALNATDSAGSTNLLVRNDGNVGIGTSNPLQMLHVGSATASGVVADYQNSSGACTENPGTSAMAEVCSSDIRLKKDIADTGDALSGIDTMRVRDFTVKATGERRTGVIAQECCKRTRAWFTLALVDYMRWTSPARGWSSKPFSNSSPTMIA